MHKIKDKNPHKAEFNGQVISPPPHGHSLVVGSFFFLGKDFSVFLRE